MGQKENLWKPQVLVYFSLLIGFFGYPFLTHSHLDSCALRVKELKDVSVAHGSRVRGFKKCRKLKLLSFCCFAEVAGGAISKSEILCIRLLPTLSTLEKHSLVGFEAKSLGKACSKHT